MFNPLVYEQLVLYQQGPILQFAILSKLKTICVSVVLDEVTLNTDTRAVDREKWEQWKHEKSVEEEELRQQREELQRKHELEDIERMRRDMVTQAQPIRKYKPVQVKTSDKPLTKPQTPKFSDRLGKRTVRL